MGGATRPDFDDEGRVVSVDLGAFVLDERFHQALTGPAFLVRLLAQVGGDAFDGRHA